MRCCAIAGLTPTRPSTSIQSARRSRRLAASAIPAAPGEEQRLAPHLGRRWIGSDHRHRKQSGAAGLAGDRVEDVVHPAPVDLPRAQAYRRGRAANVSHVENGDGIIPAAGILDRSAPAVTGRSSAGRDEIAARFHQERVGVPAKRICCPPDGEPLADPAEVDRNRADADGAARPVKSGAPWRTEAKRDRSCGRFSGRHIHRPGTERQRAVVAQGVQVPQDARVEPAERHPVCRLGFSQCRETHGCHHVPLLPRRIRQHQRARRVEAGTGRFHLPEDAFGEIQERLGIPLGIDELHRHVDSHAPELPPAAHVRNRRGGHFFTADAPVVVCTGGAATGTGCATGGGGAAGAGVTGCAGAAAGGWYACVAGLAGVAGLTGATCPPVTGEVGADPVPAPVTPPAGAAVVGVPAAAAASVRSAACLRSAASVCWSRTALAASTLTLFCREATAGLADGGELCVVAAPVAAVVGDGE